VEFQEVNDLGWPIRSIEFPDVSAEEVDSYAKEAEQWLQGCVENVIRPNGDEMFLRNLDVLIRPVVRSSICDAVEDVSSLSLRLRCDSWRRYRVEVHRYRYTQEQQFIETRIARRSFEEAKVCKQ